MSAVKRAGGPSAALVSMFLAACGGGGGGSSPPPPPPPGPAPYTLTPATATAAFVAGYPSDIVMTARQTVAFSGLVYIAITADVNVVQSPISVAVNSDSTATVTVQPLASLVAGHYAGNFTVNVCTDAQCAHPLSGAPFKVPYDITVISPDGGVTAYNESALSALPGAADWGTFQGNAAHTGYVPVTLDTSKFNRRWRWDAPADAGVQWLPSAITTGNGLFYVSSGPYLTGVDTTIGEHELLAYRESDGSKVWSHSFDDLFYATTNPPAFAGGKVYIAGGSASSTYMFAFDAASGTQVFKSQMSSQFEHYLAPTVFNGTVYTDGGGYGGMYAFDAGSGSQTFFANAAQWDGWTPAVDATRAYGYTGGVLNVYDNQTGTTLASIADPTFSWSGYTVGGAPVLGAANVVYAANLGDPRTNAIVSFDTANDVVRWTAAGPFAGNPAYDSGVLYAADGAPFQLEALSEADGSTLWTWTPPAGSGNFVGDVLLTTNLVFVSTLGGTYAIDRTTHHTVWSDAASGPLALSADGVLYIRGSTSIIAINLH